MTVRLLALALLIVALVVWAIDARSTTNRPDADLLGMWTDARLDGQPIPGIELEFRRSGTYVQRKADLTWVRAFRVENRGNHRVLISRLIDADPPDLRNELDFKNAPETTDLFKVEGDRLTVKATRVTKGQQPIWLPPAQDFASEPRYSIFEARRR